MASLSITHIADNLLSFFFRFSLIIMHGKWHMKNLRVSLFGWIPLVLIVGFMINDKGCDAHFYLMVYCGSPIGVK